MDFIIQNRRLNAQTDDVLDIMVTEDGELELINYHMPKQNYHMPKQIMKNWFINKERSSKRLINSLSGYYSLKNSSNIVNYLLTHQITITTLELYHKIIRTFFPSEDLVLMVDHDPMDNQDELVISIETGLKAKTALDKVRILNKELRNNSVFNRNIMVDLEFK